MTATDFEQLLAQRRRSGADRFDEVWEGVCVGVQELLVVDGQVRTVRCFALQDGQRERDRSEVLEMTTAEVVAAIDWACLDD